MDQRNEPHWNVYYRTSAKAGLSWSGETVLSSFVVGYSYIFADSFAFRLATTSIWISTTGRIRRQRGVRATTGSHPAMFGTRDNARGCCRTGFVANGNGALCAAVAIVPLSAGNNPSWRIERSDLSRTFSPNAMIHGQRVIST